MPVIADKFGKASISSDYAIATTVKTTRLAGATVLEAIDLSKFAPDTPVFFITYKKTTDPVTGIVSVTNQMSWKALVNTGANTLTNLTIQPGYVDSGNAVGDFIECIPTSAWENSLIDGIRTSLNDDGTLKTSAVQAALNISGAIPPDYTVLATVPSALTALGMRSYQMTYAGVDYTDRLMPGTKLRTVRSNAAPIQSTLLNGTNQFWNNTSPQKFTWIDDFAVSAWIKIVNYQGTLQVIVSRYNGTNGIRFAIEGTSGKLFLIAHNGGAGNYSQIGTQQSVPQNQWIHVGAQLDMSAFTNTPTTSYMMINGVDTPAVVSRAGTNPTALVQAGNIEVGSENGGTNLFKGNIAQVAVFNTKVTQATMLSYMSQGIIGTETGLASAWSFSNSVVDLNTPTPNNLTINGAVTATAADSPFGGQAGGLISATVDYGIIMQVTKPAADTIVIVQVPEGCTLPNVGGLAGSSYSSASKPFGFPSQKNKWMLEFKYKSQLTIILPTANLWANIPGVQFYLPLGNWDAQNKFNGIATTAVAAPYIQTKYTLSDATTTQKWDYISGALPVTNLNASQMNGEVKLEGGFDLATATIIYLNASTPVISGQTNAYMSADEPGLFRFYNGYLY